MKKINILLLFFTLLHLNGYSQTATAPSGSGSSADPYLISSLDNLYWVSTSLINNATFSDGKFFLQTNDIDASSTSSWTNKWIPIGGRISIQPSNTSDDEGREFRGTYNGAGYTIDGVTYNNTFSGNNLNGFFGIVKGKILNLRLTNLSITTNSAKTGGLVAMLKNGGGLIYNCSTSGTIASTNVASGGLVGQNQGQIFNSYSTCAVSASSVAGGLLGLNQGNVYDSYSQGSVTTTINGAHIGGLIAEYSTNPLFRSYANTSITIAGNSTTNYDGGLIGRLRTNMSTTSGSENYWNTDVYTIGRGTVNTNSFFGSGLTSEELKDASNFGANWDFVNTWGFGFDGYPTLINKPNIWLGINSDWNNTSNWSLGVVPNSNAIISPNNTTAFLAKDMVDIPTGLSNYPVLTGNVTAYSIQINNGASIDLNGFSITSSFYFEQVGSNTSTWTGSTNNLWNDSSNWNPQFIPQNTNDIVIPNTINKPMISSSIELVNMTIQTGASLTLQPLTSLKVNGNITNNGQILFKSDATGSGQFDAFAGTISGSGNVVIERYIPARRAFRFLSSAITSSGSINANWQEGATSNTDNPNAGFGTHITGSTTGASGFDATPSGNPSLFTFDNATQSWEAVTNTDVNAITAGTPYRILVRGDRSIDVTSNSAVPTPTTIRSTGATTTLNTGTISINGLSQVASEYNFIGNPYPAAVDMNQVLSAATNMNQVTYWVWDPTLGGTPTPGQPGGRGAYVAVNVNDNTSNNGSSNANRYLQPGQAAFVQTAANGATTMSFEEGYKAVSQPQTQVFNVASTIRMKLYDAFSFANAGTSSDGLLLKFSEEGSNQLTFEDAMKFYNQDENLASVNGETLLSIESRAWPEVGETIPLFNNQYRKTSYVFEIELNEMNALEVLLKDHFTGTTAELQNNTHTLYAFEVDATIPASIANDRFEIVFEEETLSSDTPLFGEDFILYPNPTSSTFYIATRDIPGDEVKLTVRSISGQKVFTKTMTVPSNGQLQVELPELSSGMYLVELTHPKGGIFTSKLIKK